MKAIFEHASRILPLISVIALSGCATTNPNAPKEISNAERVKMLLPIASANISDNDSTGGLQVLSQIRELDDSIPEEYYLFALAYLQKNEIKLATESARHAVKLDPKYSAAKNTLGKLLLDQNQYEEAEKYLLQSATDLLFREAYLPKINLGILYSKKGMSEKSEYWLSQAIHDGGSLVCLAYFHRANLRYNQNQYLEAERDFNRSAKGSCSGISDVHIAFGKTLIREKKYDQARAKFIEIQRLFPSSTAFDQATQYLREIP